MSFENALEHPKYWSWRRWTALAVLIVFFIIGAVWLYADSKPCSGVDDLAVCVYDKPITKTEIKELESASAEAVKKEYSVAKYNKYKNFLRLQVKALEDKGYISLEDYKNSDPSQYKAYVKLLRNEHNALKNTKSLRESFRDTPENREIDERWGLYKEGKLDQIEIIKGSEKELKMAKVALANIEKTREAELKEALNTKTLTQNATYALTQLKLAEYLLETSGLSYEEVIERRNKQEKEQVGEAGNLDPKSLRSSKIEILHFFRMPEFLDNKYYPEIERGFNTWRQVAGLLPENEIVEASDKEVADYYNQNKDRYVYPERRDILILGNRNLAKVKEARQLVEDKELSWLKAFREYNNSEIIKAVFPRGEMIKADGAILTPEYTSLFVNLPAGEISEPKKIRGEYIIVKTEKVYPGKNQSLDEVKEDIRKMISGPKDKTTKPTPPLERWKPNIYCFKEYKSVFCGKNL